MEASARVLTPFLAATADALAVLSPDRLSDRAVPDAAAAVLLAADPSSAPVTHLGLRLFWTFVLLVVLALAYLGMHRGWLARARRQADLPALPVPTDDDDTDLLGEPLPAMYLGAATHGDWLDRIAARGLGSRSGADLAACEAGLLLARDSRPTLLMPWSRIRGVRFDDAIANRWVGGGHVLVITWRHGDRDLDLGLRPDRDDATDALLAEIIRRGVPVGGDLRPIEALDTDAAPAAAPGQPVAPTRTPTEEPA